MEISRSPTPSARVHTRFLAKGATWWGSLDPESGEDRDDVAAGAEAEDLRAVPASACILPNGRAYVVDQDSMPAGGPIAALLRY